MKQTLFIDTNIYLRFYDSNSSEFKKLLKSIEEVKDNIFITLQIQYEIERNKLNAFIPSFIAYEKQLSLNRTLLPEHLGANTDKELKDWNTANDNLVTNVKEQKKVLREITEKLIEKIIYSKDEVSQTLGKLFSASQSPTSVQIDEAKKRKEIGNPPGKSNDPLGDQISWEQLLDIANNIDELWIISNDSDYMVEFAKKCYLNAFLVNELKQKNNSIKLHCFNKLSEGFASFNLSKKISALPTIEELEKITTEERNSNQIQNLISSSNSATFQTGSFRPSGTQGAQDFGYAGYSSYIGAQGPQGASSEYLPSLRACLNCKQIYPLSNFSISPGLYSNWCQECRSEIGDTG